MRNPKLTFYEQLKIARLQGSGQKAPKKYYVYFGTDEKVYGGTDNKVYAAKKGE